jgi:CBS domain-containing protein
MGIPKFKHLKRRINMHNIKVKDLMSVDPVFADPDDTLQKAAQLMKQNDCGMLPVGRDGALEGIITDRDIVIRATAEGAEPFLSEVRLYMTKNVFCCNENDYLEDAAKKMHTHKISRLLVKNRAGQVVGVLSFGGILRQQADAKEIGNIVKHATHDAVA